MAFSAKEDEAKARLKMLRYLQLDILFFSSTGPAIDQHGCLTVLVNNYQVNRIWTHPGNRPLGMSVKEFLDGVD